MQRSRIMNNHADLIKNHLEKTTIFQNISEISWQKIVENSHFIDADKGKTVFFHNDESSACYFLIEGSVKLYRETEDGDDVILSVLQAGDFFGEMALFNNYIHETTAELVSKSKMITLPLKILSAILEEDKEFSQNMLLHLAHRNRQKDRDKECNSLQEAPQRIGCYLLKFCKDCENDETTITLPYEKSLLSKKLNMRPETFSRALNKLQKDLGLEIESGQIKIKSINSLSEYTCVACSSQFPCDE